MDRVRSFAASIPTEALPSEPKSTDQYADKILPFGLYRGKRGNLERIGDQINKAYHFGIYDGCLVLMRRLIEMLLILAFNEKQIGNRIRGADGNYVQLAEMVAVAAADPTLDLTRNSKSCLREFRDKGNLSAHNPFYNARQNEILDGQLGFRVLVEELFYKAGILT